ncbi:MAG TPA: nucleoid-associated protein [Bacteroidales bacterium]|nr:nucleoid-associated protein [Bacteroidales bacterium]
MNNYLISEISGIAIHHVGNKNNEEGILLSEQNTEFDSGLTEILVSYFLSSFKSNEYYNLYHESDIDLNEVYNYAGKIFSDQGSLYDQSVNLAKHLYNCSSHPKVRGGEFYTVYFRECTFEGRTIDALGLFKSESKDTFLKVRPSDKAFKVESDNGININKLDKGCLIFNTDRENGYVISVVDNSGKGSEAAYWMDDFLHAFQRNDDYHNTRNVLSLCREFITKQLPQEYEVTKADQADFLNKSIKFFKEKESFGMQEFANEVMEQPELIEQFNRFRSDYQEQSDIQIADSFAINESAVKKQSRIFKSVLKLDRNFHIYIHGDRELIQQGTDPDGRKFYKIYFREES